MMLVLRCIEHFTVKGRQSDGSTPFRKVTSMISWDLCQERRSGEMRSPDRAMPEQETCLGSE